MSNETPGTDQGNERLAAIIKSAQQSSVASEGRTQPVEPSNAAGRSRERTTDDSENVDPGSDAMQGILDRGESEGGASDEKSGARRAGEAAGKFAMFTGAALAANAGLSKLAGTTLRLNESLSEWNGEIARAAGLARAAQIERQIQQGATIGGAHARASEANQEYRDMMTDIMSPLQSAGLNIGASVLEMRNWALGVVAPALTDVAELMDWMVKNWWFGDDEDDPTALGARAFLSDLSDGKFDGVGTSYMNAGNRPLMSDADRRRIFGP